MTTAPARVTATELPKVWSHALSPWRPWQNGARPEILTRADQVTPPSWLTESSTVALSSTAPRLKASLIQVTITLPAPEAVSWGWSLNTLLSGLLTTVIGADQFRPPSPEWATTMSLTPPPDRLVARYTVPAASKATEGSTAALPWP